MKKKVAITFPRVPFCSGGAELHVANLRQKLIERGYNAEVIDIPFKWYPIHQLWEQMLMWKTIDLTEADGQKIDILIGTKWPSYFAKHDNKILWLIHQHREAYDLVDADYSLFKEGTDGEKYLKGFRDADTKALKEAKKIFTISKNVSTRLENYNGILSETLYHPPKHEGLYYNESFGDYILSVGRLESLKRIDLLINAMKYTDKDVKCLIAGTGKSMDQLQLLITQNGLEDRVKLIGFVDDKELLRLYANCFGVYFAPVDEDYGYITLEAFLSQKPVITAKDSGGVLEFAVHEKSGIVCAVEAMEIGEKINELYYNKKRAQEMGICGYEAVKDISWDNALDKLLYAAEKSV